MRRVDDITIERDRLLSRCSLSENASIVTTSLYEHYKLECIDIGQEPDCTSREFSETVLHLFPDIERKKIRMGKIIGYAYNGLQLKPLAPLQTRKSRYADLSTLPTMLHKDFKVTSITDDAVSCEYITEFVSNENRIIKTLIFNKDFTYQVLIGEQEILLKPLLVKNEFDMNLECVLEVCAIVKKIKLCSGSPVTNDTVCSRLNIIEQLKDTSNDKVNRQIRSVMCSRVVTFNSRTNSCTTCQKMTLQMKAKKKTSSEQESTPSKNKTLQKEDIKKLIPNASEEMLELFLSQANNSEKIPTQRRFSKEMITTSLQIFTRSPHVYKMMRDSGLLILPSPQLLVSYKSQVKHDIGFSDQIFRWMHAEACRLEIPEEGYTGGILLDEMAIQADLQIQKSQDAVKLIGLENIGQEGNTCNVLRKGKVEQVLATHVLQFVFFGVSGFNFPFAHFTTTNVQSYELYTLFWEAVSRLSIYGFKVAYVSMDGAQSNRTFINMNIGKNSETMLCKNPSPYESDIVFIMDPSHVIKKIRNNILKSGNLKGCTRYLELADGNVILWQMWLDVYKWDQCNALKIHKRLTNEHMHLSSQSKMRNHLAVDVLDKEMLNLFQVYQSHLTNKTVLSGPIELLKKTSVMIEIFSDKRPILSTEDYRLGDLKDVMEWFLNWEKSFKDVKDKGKKLMSMQCMEDVKSCLLGFYELCTMLMTNKKIIQIVPAMINSDLIENHFCQQRATFNGANTNPTALQYRHNINSIILSQNVISQKANAGRSSIKSPSLAFTTAPKKVIKRTTVHSANDDSFHKIKVLRM